MFRINLVYALFAAFLLICFFACTPKNAPLKNTEQKRLDLWFTGDGGAVRLEKRPGPLFTSEPPAAGLPVLEIDANRRYQRILGFGATMTGSSAYVLSRHLDETKRKSVMEALFSREKGIGLSYLRMTVGASDFSTRNFSYNDPPAGQDDPDLRNFSIEPERGELIPRLREAFALNPDLELMGSPWSAPAFMKTSGSMVKGKLKPGFEALYARYLVRYIEAFQQEGIKISAITIQNEPEFEPPGYPGMLMPAEEQRDFIRQHLGPAFRQNKVATKIVVYDHNWDKPEYPLTILADPAARDFVDGSAFHCYGGDPANQAKVHDAFPDKNIYFTECSSGGWSGPWRDDMRWKFRNLIAGNLRNWASCVLLWNLALDEKWGPTNGGCLDCRGLVTVGSDGKVDYTIDFYALAHLSRFVRKGAYRVFSSDLDAQGFVNVAFINPDGAKVLVVLNDNDGDRSLLLKSKEGYAVLELPAHGIGTYRW